MHEGQSVPLLHGLQMVRPCLLDSPITSFEYGLLWDKHMHTYLTGNSAVVSINGLLKSPCIITSHTRQNRSRVPSAGSANRNRIKR